MNSSLEGDKFLSQVRGNNTKNSLFYDSISLNLLPDFAVRGGLDSGCDLDIIKNYIIRADSILEVGASYGRVIDNLLKRGYGKKLVAVERSKRFCELLKQKFSPKIEIIHCDIKFFESSTKFDLILWLWSGICDFSQEEQPVILSHIASFLKPGGVLVLDSLLPITKPANAEHHDHKYAIISGGKDSALYVYTPTPQEIESYSERAGLDFKKSIAYTTTTNRNRMLYLLSDRPLPED